MVCILELICKRFEMIFESQSWKMAVWDVRCTRSCILHKMHKGLRLTPRDKDS